MVPDKLKKWNGFQVKDWNRHKGVPKYGKFIYRLRYDWENEEPLEKSFRTFISGIGSEKTAGLIVGIPDEMADHLPSDIDRLIAAKDKFPALRYLFLGEIDFDEFEISWIEQGNGGEVLAAFPGLEELRIRGGTGLAFSPARHICLKKLVIQAGGISKSVLKGIGESIFPELEHLEIWLGTDEYGWDGNAEDVRRFLYDNPFPKLKYLGLKNCDHQDDIAKLAAEAPVLDQLDTLDLSMGALKDDGGEALLNSGKVEQLKKLDLHYHYMSKEMTSRFSTLAVEVDIGDRKNPETYEYGGEQHIDYYVSVGE